jgi:outer membrane protein
MFILHLQMQGALNAHESSIVALESRQEAYHYAKKKIWCWLDELFRFKPVSNFISTAQSDVLRTKYDYIFKIKILEFYFGILSLKLIHYVKKTIYLLIGGAIGTLSPY